MACRPLRACLLHQRADPRGEALAQPGDAEDHRGGDEYGRRGRQYRPQPAKELAQAEPVAGRLVGDLAADPIEAVSGRHDAVCRGVQRAAQPFAVLGVGVCHDSRSSTLRSADMPRAVWLFTAPRLIAMTLAIWASDRSA